MRRLGLLIRAASVGAPAAVEAGIPLVISPNSILAVRADLGVTTSGADVTAVADQSGEAHDYSNAGSGTYVQYDDTTWGLPVLTALNTSSRLVGHADVAAALLGDDTPWTVFGLVYRPTGTGDAAIWGIGEQLLYISIQFYTGGRMSVRKRDAGGIVLATSSTGVIPDDEWTAFCVRNNGNNIDFFFDSATPDLAGVASNAADPAWSTNGHTLCARPPNFGTAMSIHEWEVCTGAAHIDDITAKMASMLLSKVALEDV